MSYFFFLINTRPAPIAAMTATAPIIAYNSIPDIPDNFGGAAFAVMCVNVTTCVMLPPFTVNEPDDDTVYPDTLLILYEYVPLISENTIILDVDDSVIPSNVTDHFVFDVRPDSVNVIL